MFFFTYKIILRLLSAGYVVLYVFDKNKNMRKKFFLRI